MHCPRCPNTVLNERERDGILIDACPSCRGVWLDRGELERLVALARRDFDDDDDHDDDHDDDDRFKSSREFPSRHEDRESRDRPEHAGRPPRRKRWYETITELFD